MDQRESNVEYMTEYLKHAIEFEKYVYVWTAALDAAQKRFGTVYNDRNRQASIRNDMSSRLASLDSVYLKKKAEEQKKYNENNSKKNKALAALLIGIFGILCNCGLSWG